MTVVVGMSGGVDSSLAALLLQQQGYKVIGMFMKNWEEKDANGVCTSSHDFEDVVAVCEKIGIPYYSVNFVDEYRENVFRHFVKEYELGHTPNPDILCNKEIKFKVLLEKAMELGGDFLATGHYCQTDQKHLIKGADPGKDQSYFLYTIKEDILKKVMFPIGHLQKDAVRAMAQAHGLSTHDKPDSTGICFIGERSFKPFLSQYIKPNPGNFETPEGKVVGRHDGIAFYTIGQRKGMGIGGPGEPWFVVGKDVPRNVVIVAQGTRHPALFCDELTAVEATWVNTPPETPFKGHAKVRYRQPDQPCEITKIDGDRVWVRFSVPQRAVTPRQSVVFYDGTTCLGGAIIEAPGPSYFARGLELPEHVSP